MAIAHELAPDTRLRSCGHHIGNTGDMNNRGPLWKAHDAPGLDLAGDGPDELRKLVRQEISRGVETIKIFASSGHGINNRTTRNMSRLEIATIVETAHERRSEEHTSELQSLMRIPYAVFCLKKKNKTANTHQLVVHNKNNN